MSRMDRLATRILYVEGNVDGTIGGSYYSLFYLVAGLDRTRYEPIVVFATDNSLVPRFNAAGVRTIVRRPPLPTVMQGAVGRIIAKAANFIRGWIIEPARLAALLRRERIALVHLNNSIVRNHSWMVAARFARIPCITHERGINPRFPYRARRLARQLAAIVCISRAVHDNFVANRLGKLRLVTIHNGLDPAEMRVTRSSTEIRAELGIAAQARVIGIVGNIKPWKGQEVVIRAIARLRNRFPDLVCLLIGDTSPDDSAYRVKILQQIADLGLSGRVLVTGFRRDVANYVAVLEVLVHASVNPEPFGRVLLEGMALHKPLIASNGGAVAEIVVDGETGLLFTPGDPESLAHRLLELLGDAERLKRMGQAGYQRMAAEFTIAHNVRTTQALYERVLAP